MASVLLIDFKEYKDDATQSIKVTQAQQQKIKRRIVPNSRLKGW